MRGGLSWVVLAVLVVPFVFVSPMWGGIVLALIVVPAVFDGPKRRELREGVRRQLVLRGLPTCLVCGYDMRGLRGETCPECGARIALD